MNTVFIVLRSEYDDVSVIGVYDDEERANRVRELYGRYAEVVQVEVNTPWTDDWWNSMKHYEITIQDDGTVEAMVCGPVEVDENPRYVTHPYLPDRRYWVAYVWADDIDEAIRLGCAMVEIKRGSRTGAEDSVGHSA